MNESEKSLAAGRAAAPKGPLRLAQHFIVGSMGILFLPLLAPLITGCGTFDKPSAEKFASVIIEGQTPARIRDVTAGYFRERGFNIVAMSKTNVVCEKQGSSSDNVVYGNWMGGEPVWLRIKLTIVPLNEGLCRLQCLAFKVRDKGSMAFEEEVQVSKMAAHHYRKIMQEVAARLRGPPP